MPWSSTMQYEHAMQQKISAIIWVSKKKRIDMMSIDMDISKAMGVPQIIIHLQMDFPWNKPTFWGYGHSWKLTFIYIYMYVYIYTHVYIYIYIYICTYTHKCIYIYMFIHIYIWKKKYIHICWYIYIYIHVLKMCICIHICKYIYMSIVTQSWSQLPMM